MALSLNQRRAAESFKSSYYNNWENEVKVLLGDKVNVEVNWDTLFTLTEDGSAQDVANYWPTIYFNPLKEALESVCSDAMGKEALAAKLTKIIVSGETETNDSNTATFADGVFTINQLPYSEGENPSSRVTMWKDKLEAGL